MSEEISTALSLLIIGMLTVFVVLLLVVITGNLLIRIVNKYFTPEIIESITRDVINPSKIAAITTAVEVFTNSRGKITRIDKE
ncbi:MAG: hypothetical protein JXQ90_12760 [Cyclobacteriaceae bacterium]